MDNMEVKNQEKLEQFSSKLSSSNCNALLFVSEETAEKKTFFDNTLKDNVVKINMKNFVKSTDNDYNFKELFYDEIQKKTFSKQESNVSSKPKVKYKKKVSVGGIITLLLGVAVIVLHLMGYFMDLLTNIRNIDDAYHTLINIAIYVVGALWIVVSIVFFNDARRQNKEMKAEAYAKLENTEEKSAETFDLSQVKESYFLFDNVEHFLSVTSKELTVKDKFIDFLSQLRYLLKENGNKKLILIWPNKQFINDPVTNSIFDEVFILADETETNGEAIDLEVIEKEQVDLKTYFIQALQDNNFVIAETFIEEILSNLNSTDDIDQLMTDSVEFSNKLSEFDSEKLIYLQYMYLFARKKYEILENHFANKEVDVKFKHVILSKVEFEKYTGKEEVVEISFDYLEMLKGDDVNPVNYVVQDDLDELIAYAKTVEDEDKHKYVNIMLMQRLINNGDDFVLTLLYSMLNTDNELFAMMFKSFFNELVKQEKHGEDSSAILSKLLEVLIDLENGVLREYMFEATNYKENRALTLSMIKYVFEKAKNYHYVSSNYVKYVVLSTKI